MGTDFRPTLYIKRLNDERIEYTIFELIWTTYMSCTYDFHGLAAPKSRWPLHHGGVGIGEAQKRFERVRLIWERT